MSDGKIERRVLGIVSVDSGTVLVGDPAYIVGRDPLTYDDITADVNKTPSTEHASQVRGRPVVLLQSFGGDGEFRVIGEFEDGEFIRAVIDFDPLEWPDE